MSLKSVTDWRTSLHVISKTYCVKVVVIQEVKGHVASHRSPCPQALRFTSHRSEGIQASHNNNNIAWALVILYDKNH